MENSSTRFNIVYGTKVPWVQIPELGEAGSDMEAFWLDLFVSPLKRVGGVNADSLMCDNQATDTDINLETWRVAGY